MDARELLRKAKSDHQAALAERDAASARAEKFKGFIEYMESVLGHAPQSGATRETEPAPPVLELNVDGGFARLSAARAAETILRTLANYKPMHINAIIEGMVRANYPKTPEQIKSSLYTNLFRQQKVFYRAKPATFGLVEWQKKKQEEKPEALEGQAQAPLVPTGRP